MCFKLVICVCVLMGLVKSDELSDLTNSMRASIEWISKNTKYDYNSSIKIATASGSLLKQGDGIDTQVNSGYAQLIMALSKELNMDTNIEAKLFMTAANYCNLIKPVRTDVPTSAKSIDTIYQIHYGTIGNPEHDKCLQEFYKDNPTPKSPPGPCVFANAACVDTLTKSKNTAAALRNRFLMKSQGLFMCTNFNKDYETLVKGQMIDLGGQVNQFLEVANSAEGLDPNLRYTFIRLVIVIAMNGYNSLSSDLLAYIKTWVLEDGSCGLETDSVETRVMLSAQCYTIWTLKREILINKNKD